MNLGCCFDVITQLSYTNINIVLIFISWPMIEQFHRILRTPKHTPSQVLEKTQDLILTTFEQVFPETLDVQSLHKIFEQVLGPKAFPSEGLVQISIQEHALLNYRLVQYFIELTKMHFVSLDVYRALENQTQKAEAINRSHIKVQQQLKIHLEYLESKIEKMQRQLSNLNGSPENLRKEILVMQSRESVMQRQKVGLIKKNQRLQNQLQTLKRQLQSHHASSPILSIKSSFIFKKDKDDQRVQTGQILQPVAQAPTNQPKWRHNPQERPMEKYQNLLTNYNSLAEESR